MSAILRLLPVLLIVPQSVAQTLPDQQAIIDAQSLTRHGETGHLTLSGKVVAKAKNHTLTADSVQIDPDQQQIEARGQIHVTAPDGTQIRAARLLWNRNTRSGAADSISVHLPETGTITARRALDLEQEAGHILEQASLTTCPVCEDLSLERRLFPWRLFAREIVHDQPNKRLDYRHAVLRIHDLPVAYLPWFRHPAPGVRRASGLLPPIMDLNAGSALGVQYRQPIHRVISPSQDVTITPGFFSKVHPLLRVEWRKRFYSGQIQMDAAGTYDRRFDSEGPRFGQADWRGHIFAAGHFDPAPGWEWGFKVRRQSDDAYDLLYGIGYPRSDKSGVEQRPRQSLSQLHIAGHRANYLVNAQFINVQDLTDDFVSEDTLLSRFRLARALDLGRWGQLELSAAGLATLHADTPECAEGPACIQTVQPVRPGQAYAGVRWQRQSLLPGGWLLKPFVAARLSGQWSESYGTNAVRGWGVAGADLSWPLKTSISGSLLLVEPSLDLVTGVGSDFDDAPWSAVTAFVPDEFPGFRFNGSADYKPWNGGTDVGVWLKSTILARQDIRLSSRIGYRWRSLGDSTRQNSYAVWDMNLHWGNALTYSGRIIITDSGQIGRTESRLGVRQGRWQFDLLHYASDLSDANGTRANGLGGHARFAFHRFWSVKAQASHNFRIGATLNWSIGLDYQDECSSFGIEFRRSGYDDGVVGSIDSINLRFGLKG